MGKEFPESELVRKTFTIRQMDFPPQVEMTKRSLLRWFALSFGLISEKESRSTILDVLDGVFYFQVTKKHSPTTFELLEHLQKQQGGSTASLGQTASISGSGNAASAVAVSSSKKKIDEKLLRYHLKRLIDVGFLERRKGKLSFVTHPHADKTDLVKGFHYNISSPVQESLNRISIALEKISDKYKK